MAWKGRGLLLIPVSKSSTGARGCVGEGWREYFWRTAVNILKRVARAEVTPEQSRFPVINYKLDYIYLCEN